tara:strand:+ start:176 stop:673 length:498 start_codon:yes stop_codon:yes gene_type:complete
MSRKEAKAMSPQDRVRYYLGLPAGYQINPSLVEKHYSELSAIPYHELSPLQYEVREDLWALRRGLTRTGEHPDHGDRFSDLYDDRSYDRMADLLAGKEYHHMTGSGGRQGYQMTGLGGRPMRFSSRQLAADYLRQEGVRKPGEGPRQAARREAARRRMIEDNGGE